MTDFEFLPTIPIDAAHTLEQLTARFQSVKDGLPELVKNSKDQYSRFGVTNKEERQILVLIDTEKRMLGVLDFAGATSQALEGWQTWSSRTAPPAEAGRDIEAGHGNGGKAFMVRGSLFEAFIESCHEGVRNKMGFKNDDPDRQFLPGYANESGRRICDLFEANPDKTLNSALRPFGLKLQQLPESCQRVFSSRRAFTIVHLERVRDWESKWPSTVKRLAAGIPSDLAMHGQAALSIETSCVWVIVNGDIVREKPLALSYPDPLPGFESLEISVPDQIDDPLTGEPVNTGPGEKILQLRTSARQLRMSESTKAINVIRVRNQRNVVGYWMLATLAPRAGSAFIYGELRLPGMTSEHHAGAERSGFADTPLVRAIQTWVASQVENLAQSIERSMARETRPEERERANDALNHFRDLMRKYLTPETISGQLSSESPDGKKDGTRPEPPTPPKEWGRRVDTIIIEQGRKTIAIAQGSSVPLEYRCYERTDKGLVPIRNAEVELFTEPSGVVVMNSNRSISGVSEGKTVAWLRDPATGVESEKIGIEVVACSGVDLVGPEEPLLQGQRTEILYSCRAQNSNRDDLLLDATIDESGLGKISRNGIFTSGYREGVATIRIRYGPGPLDHASLAITIGSDAMPLRGRGGGGDVPLILMCGTEAPGMETCSPDQRTLHGGELYPTIIEEPQFLNVVWLNHRSKEAIRAGRPRGGPTGVPGISTLTFYQFLALKCFEILKRLWVRQQIRDLSVTEREFSRSFAEAEMGCVGFIDAAYELAQSLHQDRREASA